jgi:hypothetical protein
MALKDTIHGMNEYQQLTEPPDTPDQDVSEPRRVETPTQAVSPVISLERGDVQFWLQVIQVILLYLILREIGRN